MWILYSSPCASAQGDLRICFYNVENLFDTADDPATQDDEFTPSGARRWTPRRLRQKLDGLSRVVAAMGEGRPPALIGLAEVENDSVLRRWLRSDGMWRSGYRYVMTDGLDARGIDVALLYQPTDFRLFGHEALRVPVPAGSRRSQRVVSDISAILRDVPSASSGVKSDSSSSYRDGSDTSATFRNTAPKSSGVSDRRPTRDLLHAWGRISTGDTLDVIVCHMPSRLGGSKARQALRTAAHLRLRSAIDSLLSVRSAPLLVVMGDFNDGPFQPSLVRNLRLCDPHGAVGPDSLYDLMQPLHRLLQRGRLRTGSYKYHGEWSFIDHFLVNGRLLPASSDSLLSVPSDIRPPALRVDSVRVLALPFMLTDDATHLGQRPRRTYYGYTYEAGYSDHLPIVMDLRIVPSSPGVVTRDECP